MNEKKICEPNGVYFELSFSYERIPIISYICGRLGHSESHFRKLLEATDSGVAHGWSEEIKAEHRRQIKNPVVPWRRETRELNLQMIMPDL